MEPDTLARELRARDVREWINRLFVTRILDGLFLCAFSAVPLAMLGVGTRIALMSSDPRLIMLTTAPAGIGAIGAVAVFVWAAAQVRRSNGRRARQHDWTPIIRRYPILIGPAAYYLGAYRPNRVGKPCWIDALMRRHRLLDATANVAWRGTLATYWLLLAALIAALLQSSPLFLLVVVVFVLLVVSTGAAFCLLAVVVLIHVVTEASDSTARRLERVARIGPLWVRGFCRYYETAMRPALVASGGHK